MTVKDLEQEITISSQEIPLAARSLLLSQRQEFLNIQLARVPISPNHERTMEMRDKVLSSVGAQDSKNSGYQVSDLDDVEFYWENDQLDVDAVFRAGLDKISSFQLLTSLRWVQWLKTRFWLTKGRTMRTLFEQLQSPRDKHNPFCWWEVGHSEQELRIFPTMFKEICLIILKYCYSGCILIYAIFNNFLFIITFFKASETCVRQEQF